MATPEKPEADPAVARAEATKLREETFQAALKLKKNRKPTSAPTPRAFFGVFQNCAAHYREASTWYAAARRVRGRQQWSRRLL
jgi:hypothetical protein